MGAGGRQGTPRRPPPVPGVKRCAQGRQPLHHVPHAELSASTVSYGGPHHRPASCRHQPNRPPSPFLSFPPPTAMAAPTAAAARRSVCRRCRVVAVEAGRRPTCRWTLSRCAAWPYDSRDRAARGASSATPGTTTATPVPPHGRRPRCRRETAEMWSEARGGGECGLLWVSASKGAAWGDMRRRRS